VVLVVAAAVWLCYGGVKHALASGRHAWLQMVSGRIELNGTALAAGDGAAVSQESALEMVAVEPAHFLLFDLA